MFASCRRIRIGWVTQTFSGGFEPVSMPSFQGVRDERVSGLLVSSAMVCLLGGCQGGRMVAGGDRRALVDPKRKLPCQRPGGGYRLLLGILNNSSADSARFHIVSRVGAKILNQAAMDKPSAGNVV